MSASEGVCACALVKAPSKKPVHKANWIVCFSFIILVFSKKYCVSYSFVCAMRCVPYTGFNGCRHMRNPGSYTVVHVLPRNFDASTVGANMRLFPSSGRTFSTGKPEMHPAFACVQVESVLAAPAIPIGVAAPEANGRNASDQLPGIQDCQAEVLALYTGRCVCRSIGAGRRQIVV